MVREIQSIGSLFKEQANTHPKRTAFVAPTGQRWKELSLWEASARMHKIAYGLISLGVEPGDRVAILSGPRVEWPLVDWAIMLIGAVSVPIYPKQKMEQCAFILRDSGAKVCVVENIEQLEGVAKNRTHLFDLERIVLIDPETQTEGATIEECLSRYPGLDAGFIWVLDALEESAVEVDLPEVGPETIATIVYTAGTTEEPKGVVLTHDNLLFVSAALLKALQLEPKDKVYWFLPLAHVMGRVVILVGLRAGVPVAFPRPDSNWAEDMASLKPTILPAVPRVYQEIQSRFLSRVEKTKFLVRIFAGWALSVGRDYGDMLRTKRAPGLWLKVRYWFAKRFVFRKLNAWFGGNVRLLLSGGGRLSEDLAAWYHNAGMTILEGYGLTESTALTHVNRAQSFKFGTVGPPLDGVEVRLDEDGEILIRGRGVMKEYHERKLLTEKVVIDGGWLRTGDIGVIQEDGFLEITDRKKELVVMASGRNIAPGPIEARLCDSTYISQAFVHGDERVFLSVLLTLNPDAIRTWAKARGLNCESYDGLLESSEVHGLIQEIVNTVNRSLASYETVRKFAVLPDEFSLDAGVMTPTFYLRRKAIEEQYSSLLNSFYSDIF